MGIYGVKSPDLNERYEPIKLGTGNRVSENVLK